MIPQYTGHCTQSTDKPFLKLRSASKVSLTSRDHASEVFFHEYMYILPRVCHRIITVTYSGLSLKLYITVELEMVNKFNAGGYYKKIIAVMFTANV